VGLVCSVGRHRAPRPRAGIAPSESVGENASWGGGEPSLSGPGWSADAAAGSEADAPPDGSPTSSAPDAPAWQGWRAGAPAADAGGAPEPAGAAWAAPGAERGADAASGAGAPEGDAGGGRWAQGGDPLEALDGGGAGGWGGGADALEPLQGGWAHGEDRLGLPEGAGGGPPGGDPLDLPEGAQGGWEGGADALAAPQGVAGGADGAWAAEAGGGAAAGPDAGSRVEGGDAGAWGGGGEDGGAGGGEAGGGEAGPYGGYTWDQARPRAGSAAPLRAKAGGGRLHALQCGLGRGTERHGDGLQARRACVAAALLPERARVTHVPIGFKDAPAVPRRAPGATGGVTRGRRADARLGGVLRGDWPVHGGRGGGVGRRPGRAGRGRRRARARSTSARRPPWP
jgi:hypothetical protein